jgi:hypothetical protein
LRLQPLELVVEPALPQRLRHLPGFHR